MSKNSAINDLREEGGLRNQFPHQMRNIFLPFRRKRFLVARASAEGNDDHLPSLLGNPGPSEQPDPNRLPPSVTPAALRKNSRRVKAIVWQFPGG